MKRIIILTVLIASTILAMAQGSVEAKIDPIEMLIGEQAEVTLTVQAADDAKVEWPTYQPRQQLVPGVEVLNFHHPTSNTMTLTLTSFDGKLYALPPFVVKINGKVVERRIFLPDRVLDDIVIGSDDKDCFLDRKKQLNCF